MMLSQKNIQKLVKGAVAMLPATIPYIMKPRRTSVSTWVLGGLGLAAFGGLVAVMALSPRTRRRAIAVAKDGYDKVQSTISHFPVLSGSSAQGEIPLSNGISGHRDYSATTTGL